ncbi:MAG: hypothetical protein GY720_22030 [bacterium]|nr:hypothetical protein [bacterium]
MKHVAGTIAFVLLIAACGGNDSDDTEPTTAAPATSAAPTTAAPPTVTAAETTTTTEATTTTSSAPEPALTEDDDTFSIVWTSVADPFWDPSAGTADDPFFFIHTSPDSDGFYFALEMFTTGYGALWQGELGEVAIICNEAPPAPSSTGICPHFDPDGPGPLGDLNADFLAAGSITINQLDDDGYDIVVNEIRFSNGSVIASFQLVGP